MRLLLTLLAFLKMQGTPVCAAEMPGVSREISVEQVVRQLSSASWGGRAPCTRGHELAKQLLLKTLKDLNFETEIVSANSLQPWKGKIENVLAFEKKSRLNKCVVLAAHYDHNPPMGGEYSPGANDNASGVAAVLEVAKRWSEKNRVATQSQVSLVVSFPDQEENFIQGSQFVAAAVSNRCDKVLFTVTLDMVGVAFFRGFEKKFFVLGSESSNDLTELILKKQLTDTSTGVLSLAANISMIELLGVPRSDYSAFRNRQMPYLFLTAGMPSTYHTPADKADLVDFEQIVKTSEWLFELLEMTETQMSDREFQFIQKPTFIGDDQKLAADELLRSLMARPRENDLSVAEIEWIQSRMKLYSDPIYHPSKFELQLDVLRVIRIVSRKAPYPAAYLRSLIGKIFW